MVATGGHYQGGNVMSTPSENPSLSLHAAESALPASQLDLFTPADDRRRIEASLKWLLEEARSCRLPPAATLAPVAGLAPAAPGAPVGFGYDAGADYVEPSTMAPEQPLVPRRLHLHRRRYLRGAVKLALAVAIAGAVAAYVSAPAGDVAALLRISAVVASINARLAALLPVAPPPRDVVIANAPEIAPELSTVPADDPQTVREAATPAAAVAGETTAVQAGTARPATVGTVAVENVAHTVEAEMPAAPSAVAPTPATILETPRSDPASVKSAAALTAREIAALVSRGRTYFAAGDLTAARLLFRRAANAGDAGAAIAMGTTYDPVVLAKHVVGGRGADVIEARQWYEKARQLGSPEGPNRIETLAHR
jgi:TPR repeat protein